MSSRALQASVHWSATTAKHTVKKRSQDNAGEDQKEKEEQK